MSRERERRALLLFEETVELAAAERARHLDATCGADLALRDEVERLLAADREGAGASLATPLLTPRPDNVDTPPPAPRERVGTYLLLGRIGQGGTSSVYLARRVDDPDHRVALKLLAVPCGSRLAARLTAEASLLSALDHPVIARLLDVGESEDGHPFLVTELVAGLPIDQHADRHRLTVDQRVDLFLTVCDAVAAAHRNLVVHRDLKPAHVLVDDDGQPKLIDFGLARLLDPASGAVDQTTTALRLLTVNYASPEHLAGRPYTTASDTYSLGVILYQLLTGTRPHERGGRPLAEILAGLASERAPPASRSVQDDEEGRRRAAERSTSPAALRTRLRGDLDRIVAIALASDPAERYSGPGELAADLRRERDGLPVSVQAPSLGYRAKRFWRRHRWAAIQLALTASLLLGASGYSLLQSRRLAVERSQAQAAESRAERVVDFLIDSWTPVDPLQGGKLDAGGQAQLVAAQGRLEAVTDPLLRARLRHTLGVIFGHVGEPERAATLLGQALDERRRLDDQPALLDTAIELAWVLRLAGRLEVAEHHARAALAATRDHADRRDLQARAATTLGEILSAAGRHQEAEANARQAVEIHRGLRGEIDEEVANDYNNLAMVLYRAGQPAAAADAARRCLEIARQLPSVHPAELANAAHNLGVIVMTQGDLIGSEQALEEARRLRETAFGADHPAVANSLNSLALLAAERGDLTAAEGAMRRALEINRRAVGPDHEWSLANLANLVEILDLGGHLDEARALAAETLDRHRAHLPADSPHLLYALNTTGLVLLDAGRLAEAEALLGEAAATRRAGLPVDSPDRLTSELAMAALALAKGRAAEVTATLAPLVLVVDRAFGQQGWQAGWVRILLADALLADGARERAARLAAEGEARLARRLPNGHPRRDVATSVLGLARVTQGDRTGLELLAAATSSLRRHRGEGSQITQRAAERERHAFALAAQRAHASTS